MKYAKLMTIGLLCAALVSVAGCGTSKSTPAASPSQQTASAAASAPQASASNSSAAKNAVSMKNFKFDPAEITINKGDTVTWTNNDSATHDAASATFKSGNMAKGQTFSFTFTTVGTFDYDCTFHAGMTGKVIVK